jgi:hypothetical protein
VSDFGSDSQSNIKNYIFVIFEIEKTIFGIY